ncbi:hypothetical protein O181_076285 [Austropuccinia psidii MF-1]|uniref:Uncharacterized protein n=1 Tax=Austropuccinia psidii MF-1 TaxID=1389203 RepID=A0A9Q3FFY2_9BASI|nr:hypothetical protein [Austropuccinia psidii MF-1]
MNVSTLYWGKLPRCDFKTTSKPDTGYTGPSKPNACLKESKNLHFLYVETSNSPSTPFQDKTEAFQSQKCFHHPALTFLHSTTVKKQIYSWNITRYNYNINYCHPTENFIPLETQSQANKPLTPSEPEGSKGKGKRHSEGLITAKKWTPIGTQRSRKPRNSASIQSNKTLTSCKGKITIINPVLTSKGKLPKAVDNTFVQGTVKETLSSKGTNQRTEKDCPEPHSGGWQNNKGDNINVSIHTPIQQEPQTTGLEGYRSGSSAPPTPQRFVSMEHGQQEAVQTPGGKGIEDKGESSHYPSYRRTVNTDRAYSDSFRLTRSRPNKLSNGFTPCRNQQAARVRPNDPEVVGIGERSSQEPEVIVNHYRFSSPIDRNINPNQIENNVVTPESNLKSDALWFQMSQFAEKTQKQFAELEANHERMKKLTASMDKTVKTLQEGHAQLSKASEEINKRLNLVVEEQHHSKRDRDCLDQDIRKLLNVYHNMKPQPQGHAMDTPYKPDAMLMNKVRSPSQYQDGDGMSYLEKEALTAP